MSFYRTLTFDHTKVPSDQTNFPVTLIGIYSYLATVANGGKVQNVNGYDIYVSSDSSGSSVLPFERVHWDAVTGNIELWIQIPTLSSSVDTVVYLQYGNSSITTDQSNKTGTWDSNYVGVYHFGDGSSLAVTDSTGNANDGTNHSGTAVNDGIGGSGIGGSAGIGGSISLVSSGSAYVDLGNGASFDITTAVSIECWFKSVSPANTYGFILSNLDALSANGYNLIYHNGVDVYLALLVGGVEKDVNGRTVTATNFTHYVGTYDGTNSKIYTDATNDATTSAPAALGASTNNCLIGRDGASAVDFIDGVIDELRISKIARSADYVTTSYNNQNSPSTFTTVGSEQAGSTPINENLSDSFTFSDSVALLYAVGFAFADSNAGNWSDAITFNLQIPGFNLTENYSSLWMDAVVLEMDYDCAFSDQLTLSDLRQPASNMDAFNDQLTLNDSSSILVLIVLSFSDTLVLSDTVKVVGEILVTENDSFTFSDAVSFYVPIFLSFNDFFIWRDAQVVAWSSVLPVLTDTLILSDSVIVANVPFWTPVLRTLSDTLVLSDSIALQSLVALSLSDNFIFSDQVTDVNSYNPFNQLFTDQLQLGDSYLIIVEGDLLQFADTLVLTDSVLVSNSTNFNSYIRRYLNDEPT